MKDQTAIIIGAGPAGLTTAYELLDKTSIKPVILEATGAIGGIAQTVNYKGNRIDIGGHRFFSKSDTVMQWWLNVMPMQGAPSRDDIILDRKIPLAGKTQVRPLGSEKEITVEAPDPEKGDLVMLYRKRLSRIYFLRKLFDYPIGLTGATIKKLGIVRLIKITFSYLHAVLFPIRPEKNLEDFFINRFGRELYKTFFRDYTEKVWGVPCREINPEWGAQRIKGLSIIRAVKHAISHCFRKRDEIAQKDVETSLIGQFIYPKLGPGQMWEHVAALCEQAGGKVHQHHKVERVFHEGNRITMVESFNSETGERTKFPGDYFVSTMPMKDLIKAMGDTVPENVMHVAENLQYRDFITVGLLLNKTKLKNTSKIPSVNDIPPENWIYIQEPDVKIARLQIFNNWSPYMVKDPATVWLGCEYLANEGDDLWEMEEKTMKDFAAEELTKIGIIELTDVIDATVIKTPKAYPAYFGSYDRIKEVTAYLDAFINLFLIGRNGMHRYNNQDHAVLTAIRAVENIRDGVTDKSNIWTVNTEKEYHEEKQKTNDSKKKHELEPGRSRDRALST